MAIFEIQGPDGKIYEVEADSIEQAAQAFTPKDVSPNPDGTYGEAPEGMVYNPYTGQMTSRELLSNNIAPSAGKSAAVGAYQGLSYGFGDEVQGGLNAAIPGQGTASERYAYGREYARALEDAARRDHAGATMAGEIGGALATGLMPLGAGANLTARGAQVAPGVARVAAKAPLATRMAGSMAAGAGMSGLYGYGVGEGGIGPRAESAKDAAILGAGIGAAIPPAAAVLQKAGTGAGNILTGAVESVTGRGSKAKAARSVAQTLERSGMSADDVARAIRAATDEGQPEFRLMDALGVPGQRRASGIVRAGGDGANEIADFLRQRAVDAPDRMAGFADDAFPARAVSDMARQWTDAAGVSGPAQAAVTADDAVRALKGARGSVAGVTYDAARRGAGPVDVRGAVAAIDDRIGGMQGVDIKGDSIDARLAGFRNRLISRSPEKARVGSTEVVAAGTDATPTSVELSDFNRVLGVKQDVEDAISAAVKAGRNNEARELGKLKSSLDAALEQSSEGYRFANDTFAKMSKPIDAVREGSQMASRAGRLENTVSRFKAMSPEEQIAARAGYGDRVIQEIQGAASEAPDVSRRFASSKRKAEADALAIDPALLGRRVDREREMARTFQRALGGSRTADNLSDVQDLSTLADAGRAMRDLSVGNVPGAVSGVSGMIGKYVGPALTGQTDATRKLIAEALMSNNIEQALAEATKSQSKDAAMRAIIEQLLRGQTAVAAN